MASHNDTPTSVYLYYDSANILVYVGITSRGIKRNREHNADKVWWQYVTRQEVEHYPTRTQAADREKELVRTFRPPFNTQYNPDHVAASRMYFDFRALTTEPAETPIEMVRRLQNRLPVDPAPERSGEGFWLRTDFSLWPVANLLNRPGMAQVSLPTERPAFVIEIDRVFPFAYLKMSRPPRLATLGGIMAVKWRQDVKPHGFLVRSVQLWTERAELPLPRVRSWHLHTGGA